MMLAHAHTIIGEIENTASRLLLLLKEQNKEKIADATQYVTDIAYGAGAISYAMKNGNVRHATRAQHALPATKIMIGNARSAREHLLAAGFGDYAFQTEIIEWSAEFLADILVRVKDAAEQVAA